MNKNTGSRAELRRNLHMKPVPQDIGVVERDGIPVEVAEAMLFTPGTKLTTAMRKKCMAARETVFQSLREPKGFEATLARKARRASAQQLVKWAKRITAERAKCHKDFLKVSAQRMELDPMDLHKIAQAERVLAAINIEAQRCDATMSSYRTEAERRLIANSIFAPVR